MYILKVKKIKFKKYIAANIHNNTTKFDIILY